ncbi:Transcription factor jumonji/aspartyl beta-hydroxylase [Macrophomina phaseolina MS6]|uniref:Transcription factor jumonji/aspartyl beta-hydroxylase n=1 Tax=Macrophomina phaseolina (strain MS6) TaxID=1126212 RepID=K2SFY4_MACPH|nr:Transcription factor jumonji/aspartyl beta-hydroxylase [Macrophomina phaseolina MS6]
MLEQESEQHQRPAKRRKLAGEDGGDGNDGASGWNIPDTFPSSIVHAPPLRHPIPRHDNLSLEAFQAHLDNAADLQESTLEGLPGDLPQPIIITGTLNHWPAISDPARKWSNPHYLMRKTLGGRRLVPIEIGRSYTDEDWGQNIITFGEFMQKYMFHHSDDNEAGRNDTSKEGKETQSKLNHNADGQESTKTPDDATTTDSDDHDSNPSTTTSQIGYLAQHDLFAQIPSLRADIAIPDHCYATPVPSPSPVTKNATPPLPPGHPSFPLLHAWFGPAGTMSPLHTDPYHNILAQVVGTKYVRLYPPRQRDRGLYPRGVGDDGVDMGNTSEVDIGEAMAVLEGWEWPSPADGERRDAELSKEEAWAREEDLKMRRFDFEERFPRFREVEGCREALLGPGECLYVPKGWWHYVRSLTPSFSVSFWWD